MISYGFTKNLRMPFDKAIESITKALKKEGFGILTKIDVKEKFKEKLGVDFNKYVILGACNPANAHKAILAEENIGLMTHNTGYLTPSRVPWADCDPLREL
jgi:uncharacterized protein (DUF302 family)